MVRSLFSASLVLGSRPGSVGVGVAGCPGCAWVWSVRSPSAPASLALVFPGRPSPFVPGSVAYLPRLFPGVSVSSRVWRGRAVVRVRGSLPVLRAVASWWALSFFGCAPSTVGVVGQGS